MHSKGEMDEALKVEKKIYRITCQIIFKGDHSNIPSRILEKLNPN